MSLSHVVLVLLTLAPFALEAQQSAGDLASLRSQAQRNGFVDVVVTTTAVANMRTAGTLAPMVTPEQQRAIIRDQQKLVMALVSRGVLVGNEVSIQPDRSFVLRVLPQGLDLLSKTALVMEVRAAADAPKVQR
jgi:hypothetical protein